ncbi:unnamed protein product, partial [Cladocopium goreaui]
VRSISLQRGNPLQPKLGCNWNISFALTCVFRPFCESQRYACGRSPEPDMVPPDQGAFLVEESAVQLLIDIVVDREKVTNGASDIGWVDAAKMGLCPELEPGEVKMYAARQFRGIIPLDDGRCTLAKGMLFIDPMRERGLRLRESCCKVFWAQDPNSQLAYAFDFTQDTAEPFGNASVNCQLAAALHMRALASEDPATVQRLLCADEFGPTRKGIFDVLTWSHLVTVRFLNARCIGAMLDE